MPRQLAIEPPASAVADVVREPGWGYAVRVGMVWALVATLAVLLARLTGIAIPQLRFLAPYVTWPLMTPLVAYWVRRFPLRGRRGVLRHLGVALCGLPVHGLLFRLFLLAVGGRFAPLPTDGWNWFATVSIELVLYASTAWPLAAALALRRAQEAELARAHAEASVAAEQLQITVSQLGPRQLDGMLGRVRQTIEESPARADAAVAALASYLRAGTDAVDEMPWTLGRELDAAAAYLSFEQACGDRALELVVEPPRAAADTPVTQWSVVAAVTAMVESAAGPMQLHLRRHAGGCALEALDPVTRRLVAAREVPC